jgi:serine/threonine protein kinase/predicted Zn-dependent protease
MVPALARQPSAANPSDDDFAVAPQIHVEDEPFPTAWPTVPGYEVLAELGRGGMGVVYKARQIELDRLVALKMILAGGCANNVARARFKSEAQAVARLQHPNIVQIFEVGEHNGHAYFSLEYVEGGSLAARLRGGPLPFDQAALLVEVLAAAAHSAHERGVVHRDLKPANVLLQKRSTTEDTNNTAKKTKEDGARSGPSSSGPSSVVAALAAIDLLPKIADFGLAKQIDSDRGPTRSDAVLGTPGYMAPEQARGLHKEVGPRTDVYALGVILYECLTGRLPFPGDVAVDVLVKITRDEPVPPSCLRRGVPRDLETICLKCLSKAPDDRYASARELADDLARFSAHEPIRARPLRTWERGLRWARRRPLRAALLAGLVLLLLGGSALGAVFWEKQRNRQAEIAAQIAKARDHLQQGRLEDARASLEVAQARLKNEPGARDLHDQAEQTEQDVEAAFAARATLKQLAEHLDEVLFQSGLARGGSASAGEVARKQAWRGLALVGVFATRIDPVGPAFTPAQREEVLRGRYELLLYLADAQAQPLPHQSPDDKAGNAREALKALALLGPATGLRTHAYHLRRARYLEQAGEKRAARDELALARDLPATSAFDRYLLGLELFHQGKVKDAADELRQALRLQPRHFWANYFLARCYLLHQQPADACDCLNICVAQRRGVVYLHLLRGLARGQAALARGQAGQFDLAREDFDTAAELLRARPNRKISYALHNNRAVVFLAQKRYDLAEKDLRRALPLRNHPFEARLTLAECYQKQGNGPEAMRALSAACDDARALFKARELDGRTLARLYRQLAQAHFERGDHDAVLRHLKNAQDIEGPAGAALALAECSRGHILYRAERFEDAHAAYTESIKFHPTPEAYLWQARSLLQLHRYADAVRAFDAHEESETKLKKRPSASFYRDRAFARSKLGQHKLAADDYGRALNQAKNDVKLFLRRGQAYLLNREPKRAEDDFEEVLRREPGNARALLDRGRARLHLGSLGQAVADADESVRRAPTDSRLAYDAACLFAQAAGTSSGRADREARHRYQERAGQLLGQALRLLPAERRPAFWKNTVRGDRSLGPVRHTARFAQLELQYARQPLP